MRKALVLLKNFQIAQDQVFLFGFAFHEDLKPLFTSEAIETYKEIIGQLGLEHEDTLYKWMDHVAEILENPNQQSLRKLAEAAMAVYEQHFQLL